MLFEKILEMSMVGCYVIAVVLVIRLLLNKCERKYSFLLWFVVFLNLILPVSIEGPFSLIPQRIAEGNLVQEDGYYGEVISEADRAQAAESEGITSTVSTVGNSNATKDTVGNRNPENSVVMNGNTDNPDVEKEQLYWEAVGSLKDEAEADTGVEEVVAGMIAGEVNASADDAYLPTMQPQLPNTREPQVISAGEINTSMTIASLVWMTGLVVIWSISLYKGIALNRQLKKSREGQEISPEGVVCAEDISAPFLWGISKPVIYLPASIEEEERTYIIAHESYHKKRFDHITKLVVFGIVTLHWFNPLVWLSYALFVRDMEISCDEAVLAHMGRDIKKQYASSLLKYAAKQNGFVLAPLTFGEPSLKSRIQNVLGYKKRGLVVTIAAVCVVALTACGLIVRPSGEAQSGSEVVQGNGEQDATVPEEPTAEPEPTKAPEVTQAPDATASPYSVYFQDILQANYEEQGGIYLTIESVRESAKYSYVESVTDYKEPEAAYSAKRDFSLENGGICRIDWIKLSSDLTLENLTFDMHRELEEANLEDGFVHGVFYDREEDKVCVIISNHTGTPSTTWMICFRPENPTDYEIYDYEYSSWFGECYYVDGTIYLHGGSCDTPYVIDVETKEGRLCTAEYTAARAATYEMSAEYARTHESALYVYWMKGVAKWEDVDIFSGLLMEAMDFFPGVADIYIASREGEVLETMVVNQETGEVTIVKGLGSNPAVKPLTQAQLDWFNESFFNQGYFGENTNRYDGIRNQFLTHEYARPEDINIAEVFYNGVGEELTEDDRLCLSGEARWKLPLYTGDMVLLSEEEHAAVAEIDVDVSKTSWDTMDSILEMHTGLALGETNRCGMDELYFNKRDAVFYHFHGDTNALFVQVRSGHYNADGTITLYYVRSGSQNWINEATEEFAVVLQPVGDSYQFVANASLETLQSQQGLKQQGEASRYKLTAVDHEDYNAVFENNGYQYHFKLDMDTTNLFLLFGEEIERSNSTGKWTVTPVYASNGAKEELLGELRGFTLDITSNALVAPNYASGDRFYGIIGEVTEDSLTIQPVEVIDRDTYIEYQMDVVKEPITYKLAADVEYIMLDANFREVYTTYERFLEHMNRTSDKVCCFVVKDGEIQQIIEPYIP